MLARRLNPLGSRTVRSRCPVWPSITSTSVLVSAYRRRGLRVGVLAVDPSSPFSGGALLGDRVRMQDHATDDGVFIRSMATRGHLGGLSWATPQALRVLSAEFRNERMMRAEEKAARLPAIMTIPLILFILPVLFVVILGPAACSIKDALMPDS